MKIFINKIDQRLFNNQLKNFNWKFFLLILLINLIPSIYTTTKIFFIGEIPNSNAINIASQIAWLNILFEIITEAIMLPLFYLIGTRKIDNQEYKNRVFISFFIVLIFYFMLALMTNIFSKEFLSFMNIDNSIFGQSNEYIKLEVWSIFLGALSKFFLLLFLIGKKYLYIILISISQMVLIVIVDLFLISNLKFSAQLGINGVAYSNIIVNFCLFISSGLIFIITTKFFKNMKKLSFSYLKQYLAIGLISGIESAIRNIIFTYMILSMINKVGDQGIYWVANNFIWSWLLLPVLSLGIVIKSNSDNNFENTKYMMRIYFSIITIIIAIWLITIPTYGYFVHSVMNQNEYTRITNIVLMLLGFYIIFSYNDVLDSILYANGRTDLMLVQSILTNVLVYGIYFILYMNNIWIPSLESIAIMFGVGIAVDSIITFIIFYLLVFLKKDFSPKWLRKIMILN